MSGGELLAGYRVGIGAAFELLVVRSRLVVEMWAMGLTL
jgi:hypothetical protein